MRPHTREEFQVAIVCALPREADAVKALFDAIYDNGEFYGKQDGDVNIYLNGRIGQHDVVLTYMPGMGRGSAAGVASGLRISYPGIRLALVVGICGAVPFTRDGTEIVLGDVIVSDSVVEYDFGRQYPDGFRRKTDARDTLGRPNREIRTVLATLKTSETRRKFHERTHFYLQNLQAGHPSWRYPGSDKDTLLEFASGLNDQVKGSKKLFTNVEPDGILPDHRNQMSRGTMKAVHRRRLDQDTILPHIHIGAVACADTVMKSAEHRDKIAEDEGAIGFEMEGAGIWDCVPCLIIKGVCDYADSHKNKLWQDYAAATGAASAKAFLEHWKPVVGSGISSANKQLLGDLLLTDPRDDRLRLEQSKGGLLWESFCWIIDHPSFQEWRDDPERRLLWIRGDAGKGKTMLMMGIVDHLAIGVPLPATEMSPPILSYFFCQGTDSRLNNAASVVRGLMYLLVVQRPALLRHLRPKYDHVGARLFEGLEQFHSLVGPFMAMLQDPALPETRLLIDAVDECEEGRPYLLDLIVRTAGNSSKIKWLLTSRNRDDIEQHLGIYDDQQSLRLELNPGCLSGAIDAFIDDRISRVASLRNHPEIQDTIKEVMQRNSDGTFLWAALVIEELKKNALAVDAIDIVKEMPSTIVAVFDQMMGKVNQLPTRNRQRCLQVLSTAVFVYRPLHLLEMRTIAGLPVEINKLPDLNRVVDMCGSFFTVRENHVYFIHQSARDYLATYQAKTVLKSSQEDIHYIIFQRSLSAMSDTLRRNICQLRNPGPLTQSQRDGDGPITPIKYSLVYWFDHLRASNRSGEADLQMIFSFFKNHCLHWFECLGLLYSMSKGIQVVKQLLDATNEVISLRKPMMHEPDLAYYELRPILRDCHHLALGYGSTINRAPLQVYSAALLFCPQKSVIRELFWGDRPSHIRAIAGIQEYSNLGLQITEGHKGSSVNDAQYSPDQQTFATASSDKTIKLWSATTGFLLQTLNAHTGCVNAIAFLDSNHALLSGSEDGRIMLWDTRTGTYEQVYNSDEGMVSTLKFSGASRTVAVGLSSGTVLLWNVDNKSWRRIFQGQINLSEAHSVCSKVQLSVGAAFDRILKANDGLDQFHNGKINRAELNDILVDTQHESARRVFEDLMTSMKHRQKNRANALAFSLDGAVLACAWLNGAVRLWHESSGKWQDIHHSLDVTRALDLSPDASTLALVTNDGFLGVWKQSSGKAMEAIKIDVLGNCPSACICFAPDGQSLLLAFGRKVFLWTAASGRAKAIIKMGNSVCWFTAMVYSTETHMLALGGENGNVFLCDNSSTPIYQPVRSSIPPAGGATASRQLPPFRFHISTRKRLGKQIFHYMVCGYGISFALHGIDIFARHVQQPLWVVFPVYLMCFALLALSIGGLIIPHLPRKMDPRRWYIICREFGIVQAVTLLCRQQDFPPKTDDHHLPLIRDPTTRSLSLQGHYLPVTIMQISPDGHTLATGSPDSVHLWRTANNAWLKCVADHGVAIYDIRFSPDGRYIVTVSHALEVKLWDIVTGVCQKAFEGKNRDVLFSRDSKTLVLIPEGSIMQLFDAVSLKRKRLLKGHKADIFNADISANSRTLASASSDDTVRIWDAITGTAKYALKCQSEICAVACSPDGRTLSVSFSDSTLRLWDTDGKAWMQTFTHGAKHVLCASWSTDSRSIVLNCYETIIILDARTGVCRQSLPVGATHVRDAVLSSTGDFIVTAKGHIRLGRDSGADSILKDFRAFSIEEDWVTFNGRQIIWLPPEYKVHSFAFYNSRLALGHPSGRITTIELDIEQLLCDLGFEI
ncbi:hypothetical protein ASPVEDRAFT_153082 [Aspergillus versicolor CBS 583.65]|uniref:NACHT domain-containing protein n=1 Tax=Aspergillus versicolor CBS 583.65 TaxID=1036611 RepID=A0A1L9PT81_ASPVE|nr:uncharacterized protein ASPVEDRAFT_153082 [Aspergillus versicolor CBS 583.65]OJJ04748.1 hypothetical protein ASPVEDRAFT_153082 [Aspergillus versicolor CBS 583.65]